MAENVRASIQLNLNCMEPVSRFISQAKYNIQINV